MNSVANNLLKLIQNMEDDFQLRMAVYAILIIGCLIIVLLIWLLLRGIRLWYWKVDLNIDALKEIEREVKELRSDVKSQPRFQPIFPGVAEENSEETPLASKEADIPNELTQNFGRKFQSSDCNVSKNGRIYTQEELEAQIKD